MILCYILDFLYLHTLLFLLLFIHSYINIYIYIYICIYLFVVYTIILEYYPAATLRWLTNIFPARASSGGAVSPTTCSAASKQRTCSGPSSIFEATNIICGCKPTNLYLKYRYYIHIYIIWIYVIYISYLYNMI